MKLISVIVPIYNVDKFLDKCILSIVNQSYKDLQIILVDDGSTDSCPEICDKWKKTDSRITVIHKKNGGLSDARNAGLECIEGDYISFVDSDDWLATNYYEELINGLEKENAQISASAITWVYDNHKKRSSNMEGNIVYFAEEAISSLISGKGFYAVAWNKLYESTLFDKVRFPVGKLHEDEFVVYQVMGKAKKLVMCNNTEYFYRQRSGSIMQEWSIKHLDALEAFKQRNNYLKKKFPNLYLKDKTIFFLACVYFYNQCKQFDKTGDGKKRVLRYSREIHFSIQELFKQNSINLLRIARGKIILFSINYRLARCKAWLRFFKKSTRKEWNDRNKYIFGDRNRPIKEGKVNLFWTGTYQGKVTNHENLGDYLSKVVVEYMLQRKKLSMNTKTNKTFCLYAIGSILGFGFQDAVVWGSGLLNRNNVNRLIRQNMDIRLIRGPLTRDILLDFGIFCPEYYGDPAILMPLLYNNFNLKKVYRVSLILHHTSKLRENIEQYTRSGINYIEIMTTDYKTFIDEILKSDVIISSALHGIILSETYGVPTVFLDEKLENQNLRFDDWYFSTDRVNYVKANNIEEALINLPVNMLPDLSKLRENVINTFPYDLWQ